MSWAITSPWSITGDLLGEGVRLLQVLGREQHGRALPGQGADHVPDVVPLGRIEARGGLVQVDDARAPDEGRCEVEPAPHPAGVGLREPLAGIRELELLEELARPRLGVAPGEVEQLPDHHEILDAGQVLVDARVLAGEADQTADGGGSSTTSWPATMAVPESGRSRVARMRTAVVLPAPLRPEHAEHASSRDLEVDAGECLRLPESLGEAVGLDRWCGHGTTVAPRRCHPAVAGCQPLSASRKAITGRLLDLQHGRIHAVDVADELGCQHLAAPVPRPSPGRRGSTTTWSQ